MVASSDTYQPASPGRSSDIDYWDAASKRYIAAVESGDLSSSWHLNEFITRHVEPIPGKAILDIGGGHGWLSNRLGDAGAKPVVVDGSWAMIKVGTARYPRVRFVRSDLRSGLGVLQSMAFDAAVARFSLTCIDPVDQLIADIVRILKPGCRCVVVMPHPAFYPHVKVYDPKGVHHRRVTGYLDHCAYWRPDFGGHWYYHRPLSWYMKQFMQAGARLIDFEEPRQVPDTARQKPLEAWSSFERFWASIPTFVGLAFERV